MLRESTQAGPKPNYGFDAPGITLGMLAAGILVLVLAIGTMAWQPFAFAGPIGIALAVIGGILVLMCLASIRYVRSGKLRVRDAILNQIDWRGDEVVLDVGTGAGLLMIGAAKRLIKGGRAIGVDVWSSKDLSNNSAETTLRNIAIEGVSDRAGVRTESATQLTFPDATFDVAVSLLCIHNIEPTDDQAVACRQIARVLKPGGRAVICDLKPTNDYAKALRSEGLEIRRSSFAWGSLGIPLWLLIADKPPIRGA